MQVAGDKRSDSGVENIVQTEQSGKTSSKKKKKDTPLLRPVGSIYLCSYVFIP